MIQRPGSLVSSGKIPERGNQISFLVAKNLKLAAFMFKSMEHCSKDYNVRHVTSTSVLKYQHQWELGQKKTEDLELSKVDRNNWAKTMENIVLLVRGMRGTPLVQCHIKIAHILPR